MSEYRWLTVGLDLGQRQDPTALCVMETLVHFPRLAVPTTKPMGAVSIREVVENMHRVAPKPTVAPVEPGWQSPEGIDRALLDASVNGKYGVWPGKPPVHVRSLKRYTLGTSYPTIVADVKRLMHSPIAQALGASLVVDGTGVGVAVVDMFYEAGLEVVPVTIHGGNTVSRDDFGGGWRVPKRDLVGAVQAQLQTGRMRIAKSLPDAAILEDEMLNFKVSIDPKTAHDSYAAWREKDHDDLVLAVALAAWYRDTYWQHYDRALLAEPSTV